MTRAGDVSLGTEGENRTGQGSSFHLKIFNRNVPVLAALQTSVRDFCKARALRRCPECLFLVKSEEVQDSASQG